MIAACPHVAAMAPYALADMTVAPGKPLISLAQNESAFPPSPLAIDAAREALSGAALYPDPDWTDLRTAIADTHALNPEKILCGAGSMELIGALIQAFAGPGDTVLASEHSYAFFRTAAQIAGAAYLVAAETDLTVDVDALLANVTGNTRIVCVANPGNPTGTRIPRADLIRLRDGLSDDVLLLIDEAYGEFSKDAEPVWDLVQQGDTAVLRTFSKAYGLAGLRAGWGYLPDSVATEVRKLLNPNNISIVTQAAATAAMRDQIYMRGIVDRTAAIRGRFCAGLTEVGLPTPDSHTNFVLIPLKDPDAAISADTALRAEGILMRGMGGYGLPHCLRATIGPEPHMVRTLDLLREWKETQP